MSDRVTAYQHGIFPRSEEIVAATRGLERGRVSQREVDARFAADLADFIQTQQEASLDYFSDGMLRWEDIFRPFVEASEQMRALVRWFDNKSFFRAPEIAGSGPIRASVPSVLASTSPSPEPRLACLPSPFLFSRAADAPQDRNALMLEIARYVIRPVVEGLAERGCRLVHLKEPWLTYSGIEHCDSPLSGRFRRCATPPLQIS